MVYNDTTNKLGIIQSCERYTGLGDAIISGSTDKLMEFTAYSNTILRRLWHTIHESTGCWEYDDSNETDLPQATANLVSGTAKYALPTDALTIKRVEVKDSSGNWVVLKPLIREEIKVAIDEALDTDSLPVYYRLLGDIIELFPASNYNSTSGLKVYYDRGSVAFVYTDTTKNPGIASEYQDLIPLGASIEWLDINLPEDARTAKMQLKYDKGIQELRSFYNKRFPAKKKVMRRLYTSYK